MTALDTNVIVRYLTQDDEQQFTAALGLLNRKRAIFFVPDLVLVEVDWVLAEVYGWKKLRIVEVLAALLTVHNLVFEDESRIHSTFNAMKQGADMADELIVRYSAKRGCHDLATFDKGVIKRHKNFAFSP